MTIRKIKRGEATAVAAYTPAAGELVLDSTNKFIYVGDGDSLSGTRIGAPLSDKAVPLLAASTSDQQRAIMGAASSGANSDITSLSGITTALSVAQGGTGSTTVSGARTSLGAASSGANTDITSITGSAASLTTSRTLQTNLASTSSASFNGTANVTPGVTGILPVANGGTGASTAAGAHAALGQLYSTGVLTIPNGAGTPVKLQSGSVVVSTDTSGNATITFPSAYTSTVLSIVVCNGDNGAGGDMIVCVGSWNASSLASFTVHCSSSASATRRVNWIAMGI